MSKVHNDMDFYKEFIRVHGEEERKLSKVHRKKINISISKLNKSKLKNKNKSKNKRWYNMEDAIDVSTENPELFIHPNGVTIVANENAITTQKYNFNGTTYVVVDNTSIKGWAASQPEQKIVTTRVTDMSMLLRNAGISTPPDMSYWDTSNVVDMSILFYKTSGWDQNDVGLRNWDTRSLTNARYLFSGAKDFNEDISMWDTSKVEDMRFMFYQCHSFNQNISTKVRTRKTSTGEEEYIAWDTKNVVNMSDMLNMNDYLNPSGVWNNGEETGLSNKPLFWNTSNVVNMEFLFKECRHFNQNCSTDEVTLVTNGTPTTYISFNTENVTNMRRLFL